MSLATSQAFWLAVLLAAFSCAPARGSEPGPIGDPAPQTTAAHPASSAGQYADEDACKFCHQDIWEKHFISTPHSALLKGEQHGCQACHGPAKAHMEDVSDLTKITASRA
jgi:hypothetical protein